jgi:hypothetical protein
MMATTRLGLAASFALAASCGTTEPATQLVLVSDTDIGLIDEVEFNILGPDQRREVWTARPPAQQAPFYLTLVRSSSKLGPFIVKVTGKGDDGFAMARTARVWFFPGETLVVPLHLSESCMKMACTDQQCAEGRCMATDMERDDLEPWTGEPPELDDGRDQSMEPATGDDEGEPSADDASDPGDVSDGDIPGGHEGDDFDPPDGAEGDDQDPVEVDAGLDAGLDNGRDDAGLDDGRER